MTIRDMIPPTAEEIADALPLCENFLHQICAENLGVHNRAANLLSRIDTWTCGCTTDDHDSRDCPEGDGDQDKPCTGIRVTQVACLVIMRRHTYIPAPRGYRYQDGELVAA